MFGSQFWFIFVKQTFLNSFLLCKSTVFDSHLEFWHSLKSVRIRSYSGPHFFAFGLTILYSVLMWENADQNNSECGHTVYAVWVVCVAYWFYDLDFLV